MIGNPAYRLIYLHRDPRDAAVSWAHDFQRSGACGDMSFPQLLEMVVTHNQPPHVRAAVRWVKAECMVITFRQVKENTGAIVRAILDYVDYFGDADNAPLSDNEIEETIEKYSFEAMSGRKRGESGDMVRSGYMLRKGISGEWKSQFSADLVRKSTEPWAGKSSRLGMKSLARRASLMPPAPAQTESHLTASRTALAQIVSPPFSCGVAWLINALLYLDVKVTNTGFNPGHWQQTGDALGTFRSALAHLKWHLPVLHERQQFKFPEPLEVRWEHRPGFCKCIAATNHPVRARST